MSDDLDDLLADFADGRLDDAGAERLLAAAVDPALARRIGDEVIVDRLLAYLARRELDAESFRRGVRARLQAEARPGPLLRRVHRRVAAQRSARRTRGWSLVAAALLLLGLGAWLAVPGPAAGLRAIAVNGASVDGRTLAVGDLVLVGATARGTCTLALPDGSEVALASDAVLGIAGVDPYRLELRAGEITCAIRPQPRTHNFIVSTRHSSVAVIGTRFRVRSGATTAVAVEEGTVEVAGHAGPTISLNAGQSAEIGDSGRIPAVSPRDQPAAVDVTRISVTADMYLQRGGFPDLLIDDDSLRLKDLPNTPEIDREALLLFDLGDRPRERTWYLRLVPNHLGDTAAATTLHVQRSVTSGSLGVRDPRGGQPLAPRMVISGSGPVVTLAGGTLVLQQSTEIDVSALVQDLPAEERWLVLRLWATGGDGKGFLHLAALESDDKAQAPTLLIER